MMRIDDRNLNPASASQAGAASEASRSNASGTQIAESAGGDRSEISSLAGRVSQSLAGQSAARAQHLAKVAKEYAAGRYSMDSLATSRALIGTTLGNGDGVR
jgi:hypothetical protein